MQSGGDQPQTAGTGGGYRPAGETSLGRGAVTSGSPFPPRPSDPSAHTPISPEIPAASTGGGDLDKKAVAGVVAAAVVITVALVALLFIITQGSDQPDKNNGENGGRVAPPTGEPQSPVQGGGEVQLDGFKLDLPTGWVANRTENVYSLGPAGEETAMFIRLDFGGPLSDLRPPCPSSSDTESEPDSTGRTPTRTPNRASPSPTIRSQDVTQGTTSFVGGEDAESESGSIQCDFGEPRTFNSVVVPSKRMAITYEESSFDTGTVIDSIVFD